jgi:hypothetical protein
LRRLSAPPEPEVAVGSFFERHPVNSGERTLNTASGVK